MKSKRLLTLIGSVCLILVLAALLLPACAKEEAPAAPTPGAPAEVYHWKMHSSMAVDHPQAVSFTWWAKKVEEASGGRLTMTIYPSSTLVKMLDSLSALGEGTVDLGDVCGGYWKSFMPEGGIETGFPGMLRNGPEMNHLFYDLGLIDIVREAYAEHGVWYGAPIDGGPHYLWATKPIRSVADFKGITARAYGDVAALIERLGGAPVFIPHDESFMALQLGTVDAYATNIMVFSTFKHYEVCHYVMIPGVLSLGVGNFGISMKSLDKLPEDLATLVKSMAPMLNFANSYMAKNMEYDVLQSGKKLGFEVVQMDPEVVDVMTEVCMVLLDEYAAKSDRCARMVEIVKGMMKQKGYID